MLGEDTLKLFSQSAMKVVSQTNGSGSGEGRVVRELCENGQFYARPLERPLCMSQFPCPSNNMLSYSKIF